MSERPRALVVEDDDDLRRLIKTGLVFEGFDVHEARDGLNALQAVEQHTFEIVILDLGLPRIDGHAVLPELSARSIPVVVVTGTEETPLALDASCVLRKPVALTKIISTVRQCLLAARNARR